MAARPGDGTVVGKGCWESGLGDKADPLGGFARLVRALS